jgi:hypothetical protein
VLGDPDTYVTFIFSNLHMRKMLDQLVNAEPNTWPNVVPAVTLEYIASGYWKLLVFAAVLLMLQTPCKDTTGDEDMPNIALPGTPLGTLEFCFRFPLAVLAIAGRVITVVFVAGVGFDPILPGPNLRPGLPEALLEYLCLTACDKALAPFDAAVLNHLGTTTSSAIDLTTAEISGSTALYNAVVSAPEVPTVARVINNWNYNQGQPRNPQGMGNHWLF